VSQGLLAQMRIRKKMVVLHTLFSLALAAVLIVAIRPAIVAVVEEAERAESRLLLDSVLPELRAGNEPEILARRANIAWRIGSAQELGLTVETITAVTTIPARAVVADRTVLGHGAAAYLPPTVDKPQRFIAVAGDIPQARAAAGRVYWLIFLAVLAVYVLVAAALELVVLPQSVYAPIQRTLMADYALQTGRKDEEIIPENMIPNDELGEIMRSRNESIRRLRLHEAQLSSALQSLEEVANDLKSKNHLLETAKRNLADADRLASLGMMSAGIAHELNTPLAVLKGLVEKLNAKPGDGLPPVQAALMLRVVGRLERLGESLLDFARVRAPHTRVEPLAGIVNEAITLVRLDRDCAGVAIGTEINPDIAVPCDPDRMVQVFVNLVRNAADAITSHAVGGSGGVRIAATNLERDGRRWISIAVTDDGPGIDPAVLSRIFEPFVSTKLDARGTGLGLAVAEGIVREHGGLLLAKNRTDRSGAIFEVLLPVPSQEVAQVRPRAELTSLRGGDPSGASPGMNS
jgi:signal transduction histidine kinase